MKIFKRNWGSPNIAATTSGASHHKEERIRYGFVDTIRRMAILQMILYHAIWDMVYLFGADWKWYRSEVAFLWQQMICWTFILVSGYSFSLGDSKKRLWRGLMVLLAGGLISLITTIAMRDERIVFGVLTMLGSCMIILTFAQPLTSRIAPLVGLVLNAVFFMLVRNVNDGYLGFGSIQLWKLPSAWYSNIVTTYLGFPHAGFRSSDYFSLVPWVFLFLVGYYLFKYMEHKEWMKWMIPDRFKGLSYIGRHSLVIYVLHQPVIYGLLYVWFQLLSITGK